MIRTQIQLDEAQVSALKRFSDEGGISMAEVVRRAVDSYVRGSAGPSVAELRERALRLVGKYASGRSDVAEHHDDYLADAFSR